MAHFYGNIQGNRGEATRMGTKQSGIEAHIRGWNNGVRVEGFVNAEGKDCFHIFATGGSHGGATKLIASIEGDRLEHSFDGDLVLDFGN